MWYVDYSDYMPTITRLSPAEYRSRSEEQLKHCYWTEAEAVGAALAHFREAKETAECNSTMAAETLRRVEKRLAEIHKK